MDSVHPYDLLGVSVDSTPAEARSAYYQLALLMHPDKGGSAADMRVLHAAYTYVVKQLEGVNRTRTLEDMEAEFEEFCREQKENGDPRGLFQRMCDFPEEVKAREYFNRAWDASTTAVWSASAARGYGDEIEKDAAMGTFTEPDPITMQITHYIEPSAYDRGRGIDPDPDAADFSAQLGNMSLSDYKDAFTAKVFDGPMPPERTFEEILAERSG